MGKKSKKRVIKRRTLAEKELGRGSYVCRSCYPDRIAWMPYTIYTKTFKVKAGKSDVKIMIAWCAECQRWLAEKDGYFNVNERIDVAHRLSDGESGKGKMSWETYKKLGGKRFG